MGMDHNDGFKHLKILMTTTPMLAEYLLNSLTMLSTDASLFGQEAVIMQKHSLDSHWRLVAYVSKALTAAKQKYTQIEKEAWAICWDCEKFNYRMTGREFIVKTDHKPLGSVLGSKELAVYAEI